MRLVDEPGGLDLEQASPFLFGGTFIEASVRDVYLYLLGSFPFLFGGTFIEAPPAGEELGAFWAISLPFRRDFH